MISITKNPLNVVQDNFLKICLFLDLLYVDQYGVKTFLSFSIMRLQWIPVQLFFWVTTRPMSWLDMARCFTSLEVSLLPLVYADFSFWTGGVLHAKIFRHTATLVYSLKSLCFLVMFVVFYLVFAATNTRFFLSFQNRESFVQYLWSPD